jgi:heat shock protein HslJ
MKKYVVISTLFILLCAGCSSAPKFSSVINKDWNLIEVQIKPSNIIFDRNQLVSEGFGELFTLRFDEERVNGIAAPNRYFAPYTLNSDQLISIQTIAGTMMVPLHEPEKLKEHDFFVYLQNTSKWNLIKGNLQLYTKGEKGTEAILIFAPAGKK